MNLKICSSSLEVKMTYSKKVDGHKLSSLTGKVFMRTFANNICQMLSGLPE